MADHSGGGDHGPVFIDVYGTARRMGVQKVPEHGKGPHGFEGPHPDGPFWLRGLQGKLPLWIAFWGGFFFGHGIVLAFAVGTLVIGVVAGLTIDPERVAESMTAARFIMYAIGGVMFVFGSWSVITVWRSAALAEEMKWGWAARVVVMLYLVFWSVTAWNLIY
ncbi:MAG: hypothetical protein JJ900_06340 [Rhodospirillales bacterium]|nr:hypothetical protein [Rhodospirillales bacterium]MBO6786454.1 hypothetical protein [Rhodospirillales bacterium]